VNACFLMRCSLVLQISFSGSRNTFFPHRGMHSPWRWTRQRCVGTPSFLSILVPLQEVVDMGRMRLVWKRVYVNKARILFVERLHFGLGTGCKGATLIS
jgi:hypothetical protein